MDTKALARARDRLAEQKAKHAVLRDEREAEVYRKIPPLRTLDARLRALVGEVIGLAARSDGDFAAALARVQAESTELCAQKAEMLVANGYPANWLDEIVTCPHCRDTGYLKHGEMCDCLRELYEEEAKKDSTFLMPSLEESSFDNFSLKYYEGEAREQMALVFDACKKYAATFGRNSQNLLFRGRTGLGKTMLTKCIAKTVSEKGASVVYETALDAFNAFEEQKFSRDAETYAAASERVKRILSCDLLILDDLGTEMTTSFTQSALYNIINSRLAANKKTIISTNLSTGDLEKRYIEQTVSRIKGEFAVLVFKGRDIRAIKKEQRYL